MRVVAAKFPDRERASAALASLHQEIGQALEADIAPLASTGEPTTGATLLAGQFPDEQRSDVLEIVERSGGEVVADVDAMWTRPRFGSGA